MNGQVALHHHTGHSAELGIPRLDGALATIFSNRSSGSPGGHDDWDRPWDAPSRVTFSLVPDGTAIADRTSELFAAFQDLLQPDALIETFADAVQSWSIRAGLNMGLVADSGEALGSGGLTQIDGRFGDIRIGAIPLGPDVFAVAAPFDSGISGTWAGDILFNSEASFQSVEQFYSVAVHEIGHALGLNHSNGPNDVMNPAALNTRLTWNDIAALRQLYGRRRLDQYDDVASDERNNSMENATRLKNPGSFKNEVPLIAYGDVQGNLDVDWFELRPLGNDYRGPVTFRVVSTGISLMAPRLSVYDETGDRIAATVSRSRLGDDLSLTVQAPIDESLFVRVANAGVAGRGRGSYSLVTTMDAAAVYDPQVLESALRQDYSRLDQSDVHSLFVDPQPLFNNDLLTNENFATATDLEEVSGSVVPGHYRIQAGIHVANDRDVYRFRTPESLNKVRLTASMISLEQEGLVASMNFFDASFRLLGRRVIARGNGRYLVQVDGLAPDADYFVEIRGDRPGQAFDTGNYTLDFSFQRPRFDIFNLGTGILGTQTRSAQHTLYVAQSQMFHFGIQATWDLPLANTTVWSSVYDESGTLVWRGQTRPGEFRSANSIVLRPGSYLIQVDLAGTASGAGSLSYTIKGKGISDPIGPSLINPATLPFPPCTPTSPEFCYPGDRVTSDPFIVVDGGEISVPPGSTTPPPNQDVNLWYWYQNWQDTPGA